MTGRSPAEPPTGAPGDPARGDLERRLGTIDAAAVVVSNVIGSGILLMPAIVARLAPDYWALMTVWLAGGLLAFAGAMAYAELATMRPRAGGEYVYLRAAYGPLPAFLTGWTSFVAGFAGAIAAAAVGLAGFLGTVVPVFGDKTPWAALPLGFFSLTVSAQNLTAIAIIAVFSVVHALGLGPGRFVQNTLAAIKVLGLIGFAVAGLVWGQPAAPAPVAAAPAAGSAGGGVSVSGWLLALVPVMFSYSGWNAAAYVSEEIREPSKRLPRALALGTAVVVLVYLAMNAVYLHALPMATLTGLELRVIDAAADSLFGGAASGALLVLSILITAGTISAMVFAGPRVYYAMARDGLFLPAAAHVHPRWRTPVAAIAAQGIWSAVLVLSGTFSQLASYTGFAIVLFAGIAVAALFVLRYREPDAPRPFRAWGYPVAPALFTVMSAVMVVNQVQREPGPAAAGLVVIGCGIPIYFLFRHRFPSP
jgi:APA family basic amino acid/polyamine antiporter